MSAVLRAPEGATANTALPVQNNWEQRIATALLRTDERDLIELLGKDKSVISRLRSGERAVNFFETLKVLNFLGYKAVSKDKLCVPDYELRTLRDAYDFVSSNPAMAARFSAWRESAPLKWGDEE